MKMLCGLTEEEEGGGEGRGGGGKGERVEEEKWGDEKNEEKKKEEKKKAKTQKQFKDFIPAHKLLGNWDNVKMDLCLVLFLFNLCLLYWEPWPRIYLFEIAFKAW